MAENIINIKLNLILDEIKKIKISENYNQKIKNLLDSLTFEIPFTINYISNLNIELNNARTQVINVSNKIAILEIENYNLKK